METVHCSSAAGRCYMKVRVEMPLPLQALHLEKWRLARIRRLFLWSTPDNCQMPSVSGPPPSQAPLAVLESVDPSYRLSAQVCMGGYSQVSRISEE
eukprot:scaffold282193_cov31-Tisochrysis_lutea.AAC.1